MTPIHRRALLAAIAGLAANGPAAAAAPARIYLMRGLFDVFSLGMDRLASHLRREGHRATRSEEHTSELQSR